MRAESTEAWTRGITVRIALDTDDPEFVEVADKQYVVTGAVFNQSKPGGVLHRREFLGRLVLKNGSYGQRQFSIWRVRETPAEIVELAELAATNRWRDLAQEIAEALG